MTTHLKNIVHITTQKNKQPKPSKLRQANSPRSADPELAVVAHISNPNTLVAEPGGS